MSMGVNYEGARGQDVSKVVEVTLYDRTKKPLTTLRQRGYSTRLYRRTIKAGGLSIDVWVEIFKATS